MQLNPVIEKELKTKMRGWKAPALITVYLLFLGVVVFLFFLTTEFSNRYNSNAFNPQVMVTVYNALAIIQFILLLVIAPALTGGSISGERERQTLDLLLCTTISPFSIVIGKMVVSMAHVLLLITASLPIMGIVFLFGGVNLLDISILFSYYLVTAVMLGSMGTYYSTVFKRSAVSMIVSYITLVFLSIGTLVIYFIWGVLVYGLGSSGPDFDSTKIFLFANPFYGFVSVTQGTGTFSMFGGMMPQPTNLWGKLTQPWLINIVFDLLATLGFTLLGARRIMPVKYSIFGRKKG